MLRQHQPSVADRQAAAPPRRVRHLRQHRAQPPPRAGHRGRRSCARPGRLPLRGHPGRPARRRPRQAGLRPRPGRVHEHPLRGAAQGPPRAAQLHARRAAGHLRAAHHADELRPGRRAGAPYPDHVVLDGQRRLADDAHEAPRAPGKRIRPTQG